MLDCLIRSNNDKAMEFGNCLFTINFTYYKATRFAMDCCHCDLVRVLWRNVFLYSKKRLVTVRNKVRDSYSRIQIIFTIQCIIIYGTKIDMQQTIQYSGYGIAEFTQKHSQVIDMSFVCTVGWISHLIKNIMFKMLINMMI